MLVCVPLGCATGCTQRTTQNSNTLLWPEKGKRGNEGERGGQVTEGGKNGVDTWDRWAFWLELVNLCRSGQGRRIWKRSWTASTWVNWPVPQCCCWWGWASPEQAHIAPRPRQCGRSYCCSVRVTWAGAAEGIHPACVSHCQKDQWYQTDPVVGIMH